MMTQAQDTLLNNIQRKWVYLEPIFSRGAVVRWYLLALWAFPAESHISDGDGPV